MKKEIKYDVSTRTQMARRYQVSLPTLNKWLRFIPDLDLSPDQRLLTPKQVEKVMHHLGEPPD